jgi:hypothetical protein
LQPQVRRNQSSRGPASAAAGKTATATATSMSAQVNFANRFMNQLPVFGKLNLRSPKYQPDRKACCEVTVTLLLWPFTVCVCNLWPAKIFSQDPGMQVAEKLDHNPEMERTKN